MNGDLSVSADIAVSGMKAQAQRLRIISENMANAESVSATKGGDPYRRQVVTFKQYIDQETGADMVKVDKVIHDESPFVLKYDPSHPAADEQGYVEAHAAEDGGRLPFASVVVHTIQSFPRLKPPGAAVLEAVPASAPIVAGRRRFYAALDKFFAAESFSSVRT